MPPPKAPGRRAAGYRALGWHQQGAGWVLHNPAFWWRTPGFSVTRAKAPGVGSAAAGMQWQAVFPRAHTQPGGDDFFSIPRTLFIWQTRNRT